MNSHTSGAKITWLTWCKTSRKSFSFLTLECYGFLQRFATNARTVAMIWPLLAVEIAKSLSMPWSHSRNIICGEAGLRLDFREGKTDFLTGLPASLPITIKH